MYPKVIPLVSDLNKLKIPIFALAMGWHGHDFMPRTTYNYYLEESSKLLLKKIEASGFPLGCRDYYSEKVLHNNGITNTVMTGCAAWYDLDYVNTTALRNTGEIMNIVVSDPANIKNLTQLITLTDFLKNRFPKATLTVVFHRGIKPDNFTSSRVGQATDKICQVLKKRGVKYHDISYGHKGFDIYNDCDIHIGFRVHAHIYNLSQRRRSILVEEDGRGAGVNEALGLRHITAYDCLKKIDNDFLRKVMNRVPIYDTCSKYICQEVDDYLMDLERTDYKQIEWAFVRMNYFYSQIIKHLQMIR